jgi:hypothetical protein
MLGLSLDMLCLKLLLMQDLKVMSISENQGSPNMHSNVTKRECMEARCGATHMCNVTLASQVGYTNQKPTSHLT